MKGLKPAVGIGLAALFFGPASCLLAIAVLLNPAAQASCEPGTSLPIGAIPDHLTTHTADGDRITLDHTQLTRAATIITVGGRTSGVGPAGIKVALMAALTESSLRMLSNATAYPESALLPNDGDGSDQDSLGMFQMRPSSGWGTVQELMDPEYQGGAFYGGPAGPNHGSPRGLLDVPGWWQMSPGAAAQAVEVSAYPDRYAQFEPVAEAIVRALAETATGGRGRLPVSESTRVVFPLPAGTWHRTDTFGWRIDPITGKPSLHTGVDYAAVAGTPILAVTDGRVVFAGAVSSGYAHLILIQHSIGGRTVVSGYAHMYADGILVRDGQVVTAGQHIADVGADGKATGPHLHFEIRPGGPEGAPIDPEPWLAAHGATTLPAGSTASQAGCEPNAPTPRPPDTGEGVDRRVSDSPLDGQVSARTASSSNSGDSSSRVPKFHSRAWWRRCFSLRAAPCRNDEGTFDSAIRQRAWGTQSRSDGGSPTGSTLLRASSASSP